MSYAMACDGYAFESVFNDYGINGTFEMVLLIGLFSFGIYPNLSKLRAIVQIL